MAKRDPKLPKIDPSLFKLLVIIVGCMAVLSGAAAIMLTILASTESWTRFAPLVETFKQTFVLSVGTLIGLIGGKFT